MLQERKYSQFFLFRYLAIGSPGGRMSNEVFLCTENSIDVYQSETPIASARVPLSIKGRTYIAAIRSVLLSGSEDM